MKWKPIASAPEFHTILTQHEDDLYPVVAFRMGDGCWLRETEGPEDTYDGLRGIKHSQLLRPPTHWMELPESPAMIAAQKADNDTQP